MKAMVKSDPYFVQKKKSKIHQSTHKVEKGYTSKNQNVASGK